MPAAARGTEVQESRRRELEIGGVFEAGRTMFAAGFLATRERADELERRVAEAKTERMAALEAQVAAEAALARTTSEIVAFDARREQIERSLKSAKEWRTRVT